jgi:glycosyltransferase involved in cell wall biosynthesis
VHGGKDCVLGDGPEGGTPNLRFSIPEELPDVAALLRDDNIRWAELHNLVGHDHRVLELCQHLGIRYDFIVHDYASFCPRITLMGSGRRYCGEPELQTCDACIADNGTEIEEEISVIDLVNRSARELEAARCVIAPSADAALRINRHFPQINPIIQPWEPETVRRETSVARGDICRVCVPGAIGYQKGFDVLLSCVRDARRRALKLQFLVAVYTCDDERLLAAGDVYISGEYTEDEALPIIESMQAHAAFLPSIWPETWSYALSQSWEAGLKALAFDIGAQAERIKNNGRGWLLPLETPSSDINDFLLHSAEWR